MEVGGDNLKSNYCMEFVTMNTNMVNNNIVNNNYNIVNNNTINSNYKMMNTSTRTNRVVNNTPYQARNKNNRSLMNNIYQDNYTGYEERNNITTTQRTVNNTARNMDCVYNTLRKQVPTFPYEKRLSKIDTLKLTIAYINLLRNILESEMEPVMYIQQGMEDSKERDLMWKTSDLTARLHWVDWTKIGEGGREDSWW